MSDLELRQLEREAAKTDDPIVRQRLRAARRRLGGPVVHLLVLRPRSKRGPRRRWNPKWLDPRHPESMFRPRCSYCSDWAHVDVPGSDPLTSAEELARSPPRRRLEPACSVNMSPQVRKTGTRDPALVTCGNCAR